MALTLTIGICYYQNRNNKLAKAATKIQTADGEHAAVLAKAATKIQTADREHAAVLAKAATKIQTAYGGHAAVLAKAATKIKPRTENMLQS